LRYLFSFGNLYENSSYQKAREDQAFLEYRIVKLESILNVAIIIEENKTRNIVKVGAKATFLLDGKENQFQYC